VNDSANGSSPAPSHDERRRLVLMGPPGAGKGTQARVLADELRVPTVSTGDLFRANIAAGTELGQRVKGILDAGDYVPDSVTNAMLAERLAQPDCVGGFVLDGYPRTLAQVGELDAMLADHGAELDAVLELTVDSNELVSRLSKRAVEEGRSDDTPEVIRRRQEVYMEQTSPLLAVYRDRGLLVPVDGMGSVYEVTSRILHCLGHDEVASA
jgi:adenylate kinase